MESWHRLPEAHFDSICCCEAGSLAEVLGTLHGASWACIVPEVLVDGAAAFAQEEGLAGPDGGRPLARVRTLFAAEDGRLGVTPVRTWCAQAREADADAGASVLAETPLVCVRNEFAGPWACRPLAMGADVVAEDLATWLGTPGLLVCAHARAAGEAYLRAEGLRAPEGEPATVDVLTRTLLATASTRTQRRCDTALACAAYLEAHPAVAWVSYPGLAADAAHDDAHRTLEHGAGPLVAFGLADAARGGEVLARAAADGGLLGASACGLPACDATRLAAGPQAGSIVLACGIETPMDVIEGVEAALAP